MTQRSKKHRWKAPLIILFIAVALGAIVTGAAAYFINRSHIEVAAEDIVQTLKTCAPYLFGLLAALLGICVICFMVRNKGARMKFMVHMQSAIAASLAVLLVINLICFGPIYNLLSQVLADTAEMSESTVQTAYELIDDIADEGIVLLKNENNFLPLNSGSKKLNVFGWSSTQPIYGGVGSGASTNQETVSLLDGLENAGYELNKELTSFYVNFCGERPEMALKKQNWTIPEPTMEEYESADIFENAKAFSDTAVIVIARTGGENADLPTQITDEDNLDSADKINGGARYTSYPDDVDPSRGYLSLSRREEAMMKRVASEFENVIVIVNTNNPMELGWVNEYDSIKGVLWVAAPGERGFNALGRILSGTVNPSGRLPDTYLYDNLSSPAANNFGDFQYDNMKDLIANETMTPLATNVTFVNYVEGIYVGYRFFETAAAEGLINYDDMVLYPFGYGLSYTTFDKSITAIRDDGATVELDVTVTNTGDVPGKDVAEVYYTPPYYNGGIEKSEVNLIGFAKTNLLQPGDTQTLTISFKYEAMASYDYLNHGCYVLEHGDYTISLRSDAHTVIDSKTVSVAEPRIYDEAHAGARTTDEIVVNNQFGFAQGELTYLSRADHFANYGQATAAPVNHSMPENSRADFLCVANYNVETHNSTADTMPTTGVNSGLKLEDMKGIDYDDSLWERLLDQLTVEDMTKLVTKGGYANPEIKSIDMMATIESEGVSGINSTYTSQSGNALPVSVMTAATWNKELAARRGELLGKTANELGIVGIYAPSMNTHRTAFGGRNFEYYSEDGLLAGHMAAYEVSGARKVGMLTYIKHFALNDQERNRNNLLCTWSNEQAIREIYLKPFELAVKDGEAMNVMSSFNYIGNRFAGACNELLNTVLRDEWGFRGSVVTDYFAPYYGYMVSDDIIRNGGDKLLGVIETFSTLADTTSATAVRAMRTASHNILYTLANSFALDNANNSRSNWEMAFIVADVVLIFVAVAVEVLAIRRYKRQETDEASLSSKKK